MRTTISSRGQTTVPAEIRRRFGLTGKSRLEWLIDGEGITVLPLPRDPARAFRGALKDKYSTRNLLQERGRERQKERRRA